MANKYRWPDGKLHSIPYSEHVQHLAAQSPNITPFSQAQVSLGQGQGTTTPGGYGAMVQQAQAGPPVDPALMEQQAAAQRNIAVGNAWDTYQQGRLNNDFGFGDSSNPFSRAALLQQSYQQGQLATKNSYADSGQLYSGSMQGAKDLNARNYSINYDALRRQYQAARDQITKGKLDRYSQAGSGISDAQLQALIAAIGK